MEYFINKYQHNFVQKQVNNNYKSRLESEYPPGSKGLTEKTKLEDRRTVTHEV